MQHVTDLVPDVALLSNGRRQHWRSLIPVSAALLDAIVLLATVGAASLGWSLLVYKGSPQVQTTLELALFVAGLFVFVNLLQRRYRIARYLIDKGQLLDAFNAMNVTMIAFIALAFLTRAFEHYSRAVVVITYLAGVPLVGLGRAALARMVMRAGRSGRFTSQRVLLVGRGDNLVSFMTRHQPWNYGFAVADVVTLRQPEPGSDEAAARRLLEDDLAVAVARARRLRPDSVFIALPWSETGTIEACVDALMTAPVSIHIAPEQVLDRFDNPRILRTGAMASLELTPPARAPWQITVKRAFDLVGSAGLLLVLAPLFALIALAIRLDSSGPVLFRQRRLGFNQETFTIWKFRSMTTTDDGPVVAQAKRDDPRITRVGAVLRRYNLDELPQLVNVLQGRMSLVGPRPHALAHDREYERKIARYARRHNVKPGITGWAQVHGLRGETDTDAKMADRVAYDIWYIDNWSFWLDLMILFRTVFSPRAYRNAY